MLADSGLITEIFASRELDNNSMNSQMIVDEMLRLGHQFVMPTTLENLVDEEKGPENHPELWMRFAEGMGNSRAKVNNTTAMREINDLVNTFTKLSKDEQYHIGLAALYCYESMQPEISETKKDGLQKFYGINDEETLKQFNKLIGLLEEDEDVVTVYHNLELQEG